MTSCFKCHWRILVFQKHSVWDSHLYSYILLKESHFSLNSLQIQIRSQENLFFCIVKAPMTHSMLKSISRIGKAEMAIKANTNWRIMLCDMISDLPVYRWVYYNPNVIANILSMAKVEENGRRIIYDTYDGGCFKVHNYENGKILIFGYLKCVWTICYEHFRWTIIFTHQYYER